MFLFLKQKKKKSLFYSERNKIWKKKEEQHQQLMHKFEWQGIIKKIMMIKKTKSHNLEIQEVDNVLSRRLPYLLLCSHKLM